MKNVHKLRHLIFQLKYTKILKKSHQRIETKQGRSSFKTLEYSKKE